MSDYLDINKIMSKEYPVTFVVGARGVGKTISSISRSIERCMKNNTKFIYLRRYETEIETLGLNLQLISDLTGYDVTIDVIKDSSGRKARMLKADDTPVGYLLALSVAGKYKSTDYTNTDLIIYDEFIDQRNRELKGETNLFINLAMTVFRDFSKYRALFLANSTNLFNCYFVDFNVYPVGKVTKYHELGIKIVMYDGTKLNNKRKNTILARQVKFLEGDSNSSLDNNFRESTDMSFLRKNEKNSVNNLILHCSNQDFGLWKNSNYYVISDKYNNTSTKYTLDDLIETYNYDSTLIHELRYYLYNNKLFFNNKKTRSVFMKLLKYS